MGAYPGVASDLKQDQVVLPQDFDIAYARKALAQIRSAVEGNGIDPAHVLLGTVDGKILEFQGALHFRLVVKASESHSPSPKMASGEQLQTVRSRGELDTEIRAYTSKTLDDPGIGGRLAAAILARADKGFGLGGSEIPSGLPVRHFVIQEPCPTCKGAAKTACPHCHASGRLPCPTCNGTKMAVCYACKGRKTKDTPNGKVPCPICHGHGRITCKPCKATGTIPCGTCQTTGKVVCSTCAGSGHKTHRTTIEIMAVANSDFDTASLPSRAVQIIEKMGGKFMAQGHATLETQPVRPDGEKGAFILPCTFSLPYADIGIVFPGQKCRAVVFGQRARIVDAPPFLDRLLIGPVRKLQSAARGGNAYGALRQAARAKAIRTAIIAAAQHSESKAVLELRRAYPVGLSAMAAQKIIALINKSLNRVTAVPALIGMGGGLIAAAGLYALNFSEAFRAALSSHLGHSMAMNAFDLFILLCGGFLATMAGSLNARRAVRSILGGESASGANRLVVRRLWITLSGWLLSAGIFVVLARLFFDGAESNPAPAWFRMVSGFLGI